VRDGEDVPEQVGPPMATITIHGAMPAKLVQLEMCETRSERASEREGRGLESNRLASG
jgi:hypothetical protein